MLEVFHSFKCTGLRLNPQQELQLQRKSEDHKRGIVPNLLATLEPQGRGYLRSAFELHVPVDAMEMGKIYKIALTEVKEEATVEA